MPGLAFSFAKKAEPKRVVKELVQKKEDNRVAIVGLEAGQLTVDGEIEKEKQLSIPCKNPLQALAPKQESKPKPADQAEKPKSELQEGIEANEGGLITRNVSKLSAEDAEALQALRQDAGATVDVTHARVEPILMRKGSKAVRDGAAPEATKDMYDAVPVESFGVALLRGMGYDPDKHKTQAVFNEKVRDHCLGLGAKALLPSEKLPAKAASKAGASSGAQAKGGSAGSSSATASSSSTTSGAKPAADVVDVTGKQGEVSGKSPLEERAEKRRRLEREAASNTSTSSAAVAAAEETSQPSGEEDVWPSRGLLVRISGSRATGKELRQFGGCEAVVLEVDEGARACRIKARLDDKSHTLQAVPVAALEPVINKGCERVRVLRGRHKGIEADLLGRSERRAIARVHINGADEDLPLRDVCEFIGKKR